MNRLLNFLHQWRLRAEITGLKAADSAKLHYERVINTVYLGALALLVLSGPGIVLAWIGYNCGVSWLTEFGQLLISLGGVVATGMLCIFYLKVGLLATHSLRVVDGLLGFFSRGRIQNFFTKELGATIRNELLNAFAWVATFCLWCAVVPVWKYPASLLLGALLALFLAFASTYLWTFVKRPIGKAFVFAFWVIVFFLNSANAFTAGAVTDWAGTKGELAASHIRNDSVGSAGQREILDARQEFISKTAKVRLREYRRLALRQLKIMEDPQRDTPALKAKFEKNAARMRVLEGQNRPAKRVRREPTAPVPAPPVVSEAETRIAVPAGNTLAQTGSWFSSNWGWLLIAVLVVGLCILACVGFATKQTWLSAPATLLLVALAIIGSCVWIANRPGVSWFSGSRIPPAQLRLQVPLKMPQSTFVVRPISGGSSVFNRAPSEGRPTHAFSAPIYEPVRPPARGLRDALDEIVPEQPGDWQ